VTCVYYVRSHPKPRCLRFQGTLCNLLASYVPEIQELIHAMERRELQYLLEDGVAYTRFSTDNAGLGAALARLREAERSAACTGATRRRRATGEEGGREGGGSGRTRVEVEGEGRRWKEKGGGWGCEK
jgi:hypothetical protein